MQAQAAAQAGVSVIQPNIGRIMDWYKQHPGYIKNQRVSWLSFTPNLAQQPWIICMLFVCAGLSDCCRLVAAVVLLPCTKLMRMNVKVIHEYVDVHAGSSTGWRQPV